MWLLTCPAIAIIVESDQVPDAAPIPEDGPVANLPVIGD
jgi:hypothetical protein